MQRDNRSMVAVVGILGLIAGIVLHYFGVL